ncbi:hypothetical protein BDY21DRAFT_334125 [Lineolata rhizophorae]|uniref:Uncharacterized protein n=1 Tax=Lineolata rhizophorae TaxID=578093 RepID=A0A6A6PBC4_9PEZI|nr:hypothetical protein BDY21DRAFT_334125 [Lineolata rhizophorae]
MQKPFSLNSVAMQKKQKPSSLNSAAMQKKQKKCENPQRLSLVGVHRMREKGRRKKSRKDFPNQRCASCSFTRSGHPGKWCRQPRAATP